jgi:hypothetical protein
MPPGLPGQDAEALRKQQQMGSWPELDVVRALPDPHPSPLAIQGFFLIKSRHVPRRKAD